MSIEAMKQALELLEDLQGGCTDSDDGTVEALTIHCPEVIANLRAAIEQGEKQEGWLLREVLFENGEPIAHRDAPYDQTSLELCGVCGWKALIPGEECLVCARQKAKPVWIQRTHLESAQREPSLCRVEPTKRLPDFVPLYAAPRQWVGLTDEEVVGMTCDCVDDGTFNVDCARDFARAIEAKLKGLNT